MCCGVGDEMKFDDDVGCGSGVVRSDVSVVAGPSSDLPASWFEDVASGGFIFKS